MHASELFAIAHGTKCDGTDECHWCSAACQRTHYHDDHRIVPFTRITSTAKRFANAFICAGCWLWRRRSVTANFLRGGFQRDRQTGSNLSWWIANGGAFAIEPLDFPFLWPLLLNPPNRFALMLRRTDLNLIHLCVANDIAEIKADTPLTFHLDNKPMTYTIYELGELARGGSKNGKEGGSRALLEYLGPPPSLPTPPPDDEGEGTLSFEKRGKGRPKTVERPDGKHAARMVRQSG